MSENPQLASDFNAVQHLAVIMDGNRRWAKKQGLSPVEGHGAGVKALKSLVRTAPKYGIKYITAYTFSTENWKRPEHERNVIFKLLKDVAIKELADLDKNNVKVSFWGDLDKFSGDIIDALNSLKAKTENNTGLHLQIALNYGAVSEFIYALKNIKSNLNNEAIKDLNEESFASYLYSQDIPDPEILIRTGGDHRLSNFLLWQCASSHLKFIDDYWPDFCEKDLRNILLDYQKVQLVSNKIVRV